MHAHWQRYVEHPSVISNEDLGACSTPLTIHMRSHWRDTERNTADVLEYFMVPDRIPYTHESIIFLATLYPELQ